MKDLGPLAAGKHRAEKASSRELIACARQVRADALRSMMSALRRWFRSHILLPPMPVREPAAGDGTSSELRGRHSR